jgi:hypothetical protein
MMSPDGEMKAAAAANASAVARDVQDDRDDIDDDGDNACDAAISSRTRLFEPLGLSVSNRTHSTLPSTAYLRSRRN